MMRRSEIVWVCVLAGAVAWWYWSTIRTLGAMRELLSAQKQEGRRRKKKHHGKDKRKVSFVLPPLVLPPLRPVTPPPPSPPPSEDEEKEAEAVAPADDDAWASVRRGDVPMFTPRGLLIKATEDEE